MINKNESLSFFERLKTGLFVIFLFVAGFWLFILLLFIILLERLLGGKKRKEKGGLPDV